MTTTRAITPRRTVIAATLLAVALIAALPLVLGGKNSGPERLGEASSNEMSPRFRAAAPVAQQDSFKISFDEKVVSLNVLRNDAVTKKARANIQITNYGTGRSVLVIRVDRRGPTKRDVIEVDVKDLYFGSAGFSYRVQDSSGKWSQPVSVGIMKTCGAPKFTACPETPAIPS